MHKKTAIILGILAVGLIGLIGVRLQYAKTHDVLMSSAMEPTIKSGEVIRVVPYKDGAIPQRGDVVEYEADVKTKKLVHRVIALPGERVVIQRNKLLVFNNENPQGFTPLFPGVSDKVKGAVDTELGNDQIFVLGDNRDKSLDSRILGPVKLSKVVGRVSL